MLAGAAVGRVVFRQADGAGARSLSITATPRPGALSPRFVVQARVSVMLYRAGNGTRRTRAGCD